MVPRNERNTKGNQARLAPKRNIQGRLGSKRRLEGRREKRSAALGTKTHWGRNRKRKDGSGLGNQEGPNGVSSVRKKGALNVRV